MEATKSPQGRGRNVCPECRDGWDVDWRMVWICQCSTKYLEVDVVPNYVVEGFFAVWAVYDDMRRCRYKMGIRI
jgi:hypothetical protein